MTKTVFSRRNYVASNTSHNNSGMLDQVQSVEDDTSPLMTMTISPVPLCRQFWKAGNYEDALGYKAKLQNRQNHLHVHPMFLHSNATSHKWAFGAIAELLDNAVDEIQNGATVVAVDKITNPKDGSSELLFRDDGGGMSPEAMRRCMSFGFTDKKSDSAIGLYGNGFKTSTMRLGADVIVFSRHLDNGVMTQSIGLLSYSFLRKTGYDIIVVPMVHYEFNAATGKLNFLHGSEDFTSNLSKLLEWSPYPTEEELLKQFDDIGAHGTKVIIFNLWFSDDGAEELDFDTDPKDIRINRDTKQMNTSPGSKTMNYHHLGYQYAFSLRLYLSILYLRIPESFKIVLRGEVVKQHNVADDLKYLEYISYKPHGRMEAPVITTIGFLKEAPKVNIHGFNVYHKNRLILPFWRVVHFCNGKGRGVVGILEANFVQPTHSKQDFEKTSLFQKLEARLKAMTCEYWDFHCGLLGYGRSRTPTNSTVPSTQSTTTINLNSTPDRFTNVSSPIPEEQRPDSSSQNEQGLHRKRKGHRNLDDIEKAKRQAVTDPAIAQPMASEVTNQETVKLMNANQMLRAQCLKYEEEEEELKLKVRLLETEIKEIESKYDELSGELRALESTRLEKEIENIYTMFSAIPSSSFIHV